MKKKNLLHPELIQKYYEDIVKIMPGHVYWKDINGVYLGCNLNQAIDAGLSSCDEIIGKTDYDMIWACQAEELRNTDKIIMETEKGISIEEIFELSDGTKKYYLSNKLPLYDNSHKVSGVLGISVEITDRKEMEEDLRHSKDEAEAANYIKTELIANIGHDLTTPIADVSYAVQILSFHADEYPELKEYIDVLKKRCEDCEKVQQRIINATSLSNLVFKPEKFSIPVELLRIIKELKPAVGSKNLKLDINSLKPLKENIIETDREKFSAVLRELISNGIQFTNKGVVSITILKSNGYFHIEVTDTGIGIPFDQFAYIFKQYTKLSRSNKHGAAFKGVGAGLYLATILADILNGTISVKSEVGKGSTFTLSIPILSLKK